MKVIDLLNRIANGEEIRFKVIDDIEYYCEENGLLHNEYGEEVEWLIDSSWLNKEVKIIEEDKKIEKIDRTKPFTAFDVAEKVDEIIDILNEMRENK